jgi:hypothetical protein
VSLLFLNSCRVSSHIVKYDTSPPAIKKQHWHWREAQIELHSLSVSASEILEYGRMSSKEDYIVTHFDNSTLLFVIKCRTFSVGEED